MTKWFVVFVVSETKKAVCKPLLFHHILPTVILYVCVTNTVDLLILGFYLIEYSHHTLITTKHGIKH